MSSFELRRIDRSKLYLSIVDQILEGIRSGAFQAGKALPAERVLAEQLGVSRGSIREAVRVLEHAGVLDVRVGSGTYVAESHISEAATLRARTTVLGEQSPIDVMVARLALEPVSAREAAHNAREQDLVDLRACLRSHAALANAGENSRRPDFEFHVVLARGSRNPVIHMVVGRLTELMQEGVQEVQTRFEERFGSSQRFLEQHQAIFDAVEARDGEAAAQNMSLHLDFVMLGILEEATERNVDGKRA